MQPYRSDRVVRVLTAIVSVLYFATLVVGVVALAGLPLTKALASLEGYEAREDGGKLTLGWGVLASARDAEETVQTAWGPMELALGETVAELRFPIEALPWGVFAIAWANFAILVGLAVLILFNLRRIFQRVRDGAPFDAQNAVRMRNVGLLMLVAAVHDSLVQLVISRAVLGGADTGQIALSRWVYVDVMGVFMALVLVSLAEVFRRGAELEDEQSLVV